jgi:hypothetical protein
MYTIDVSFAAPDGFLDSGEFDVTVSSWICANGLITGSDDFSGTPEPGTILLAMPALVLTGYGAARGRRPKSGRSGSPLRDS